MKQRRVPAWLSGSLVVGAFGLLWLLERRRPLRREVEPKPKRNARNLRWSVWPRLRCNSSNVPLSNLSQLSLKDAGGDYSSS